jgi:transcriptional regulator with XRE-family HTH domain
MSASGQEKARQFEAKRSTERKPYHYVGAGLPNVYLIGVEYRVEKTTGMQSADIPCLPLLLDALAKALLTKNAPLTADELRFLRKRLRISSKDFAEFVGKTAETYSRLENGAPLTPAVDRLVRLVYAALAKLSNEDAEGVARTQWTATLNHEERIIASHDENHNWIVKTKAA